MKVVMFTGLSHPMMMHPAVLGEPALTAQAFYYLSEVDAVAQLRFETKQIEPSEESIEFLVDSYLFGYSKRHPEARISFKVSKGKLWLDDPRENYLDADGGHTRVLAIDVLNDPSVAFVEAVEPSDTVDLNDWNIGVNYVRERLEPYVREMGGVLDKRVRTAIAPSLHRNGYMGKLRVVKSGDGLIDYWQAIALADISIRSIPATATTVPLAKSEYTGALDHLPVERIDVSAKYTSLLLSYYFSGLKEINPLKAFAGFYNVLEYYFEEAPQIVGRTATSERQQLHCVLDLLVSDAEVDAFLKGLSSAGASILRSDLPTSSGIFITAYNPVAVGARAELARWLYDIRCAIVHSKKTRRGMPTATFEPYSTQTKSLRHVVPIIQWLAVACIEKDADLCCT